MTAAKHVEFFKGWLAFKHGKTLRTREGKVKVFASEASALKAAAASKMEFGIRR